MTYALGHVVCSSINFQTFFSQTNGKMTSVCTFSLDRAQTLEFKHAKIKDENRQE